MMNPTKTNNNKDFYFWLGHEYEGIETVEGPLTLEEFKERLEKRRVQKEGIDVVQ